MTHSNLPIQVVNYRSRSFHTTVYSDLVDHFTEPFIQSSGEDSSFVRKFFSKIFFNIKYYEISFVVYRTISYMNDLYKGIP